MDIKQYWNAILKQDKEQLRSFFHENASIRWHNTNESFTVNEFLIANCEYPGSWNGTIDRMQIHDTEIISVAHVYDEEKTLSFHVVSFIKLVDDKIISIDEYWGDDGEAPQWRLDKHIGKPIH